MAVVLWGTDNIKTYGESLAQVMMMVGVNPVADPLGRVNKLEVSFTLNQLLRTSRAHGSKFFGDTWILLPSNSITQEVLCPCAYNIGMGLNPGVHSLESAGTITNPVVLIKRRKSVSFKPIHDWLDVQVIPLEELGRPRIDVVVNCSGVFRDLFVNQMILLDRAVKLAADQDEPLEMNFVRKHAVAQVSFATGLRGTT